MLIKEVKIKGLAPHNEIEFKSFKELNIFIGQNNSGKSSILDAISLITNIKPQGDVYTPHIHYKTSSGTIRWTFNMPLDEIFPVGSEGRKLFQHLKPDLLAKLKEAGIDSTIGMDHRSKFQSLGVFVDGLSLFESSNFVSDVNFSSISTAVTQHFAKYLELLCTKLDPIQHSIFSYINPSVEPPKDIVELRDTRYKKFYEDFIQYFKLYDSVFPEIDVQKSSLISVLDRGTLGEINSVNFKAEGLGCQRAFQILWEIFVLKKTKEVGLKAPGYKYYRPILIVDEPELSMHPGLQRKIMEQFVRESGEMQIFVATHSPIFARLLPNAQIFLMPVARSGQALKIINNPQKLVEITDILGIRNEDYFGYSKMLILEGDTEVAFLDKLLLFKNIDLGSMGLNIVNMRGNTRFKNYKKNYAGEFFRVMFDFNMTIRVLTDNENNAAATKENLERDFKAMGDRFAWCLWETRFEDAFPPTLLFDALIEYGKRNEIPSITTLIFEQFSEELKTTKIPDMCYKLAHEKLDKVEFGSMLAECLIRNKPEQEITAIRMFKQLLAEIDLSIELV